MEFFLNFRQLKWNVSVALASGLLMVSSFAIQPAQADAAKRDIKFDAFLQEVRLEAASNGIAPEFIAALDGLHPDPEIQRLASRQPEYVKPIWSYLTHLITQKRLEIGRTKLAGEADILAQLEQEYGVPRGILVAIWGVETNYGSNKGYFPVLQALATLGYEGKRAKFGRQQLLAALEICNLAMCNCRTSKAVGPAPWATRSLFQPPILAIRPMVRAMAFAISGQSRMMRWHRPPII